MYTIRIPPQLVVGMQPVQQSSLITQSSLAANTCSIRAPEAHRPTFGAHACTGAYACTCMLWALQLQALDSLPAQQLAWDPLVSRLLICSCQCVPQLASRLHSPFHSCFWLSGPSSSQPSPMALCHPAQTSSCCGTSHQ